MKLILACVVVLSVSPHVLAAEAAAKKEIRAHHVKGGAKVGDRELHENDLVKEGETITVANSPDAIVDLKFPEGHQLRLKSGAEVTLEKAKAKERVLKLIKGRVFVHFEKSPEANNFTLRSKTAVAGVRGTKFMEEYDEKKGSYVCVCEGTVDVQKASGGTHQAVKAGEDLHIEGSKPLAKPAESPGMVSQTREEFDNMQY